MKRQAIPAKMRAQCFALAGGKCELCGERLTAWECDHAVAWFYTETHDAENLQALCPPCHRLKTKLDVRGIAKVKRLIAREAGTRRARKPIASPGFSKALRKRLNGTVERRT